MRQTEEAEVLAFEGETKLTRKALKLHVTDDEVRLTRRAISEDGPFDVGDDGLNVGFVEAQDRCSVKRHAVDELDEGILNIFERTILMEMFAVDGGDDGDDRREKQEAAVTFVGFDDKIFAATEARGCSSLVHFPTNDECGIEMSGGKNRGYKGGCGGFAVSATDGDAVLQAHQLGQHFGTGNHGDFALVRFDDFRIVGFDRRRGDDHVRIFDIASFVAFVNRCAKILQAFCSGGRPGVRA